MGCGGSVAATQPVQDHVEPKASVPTDSITNVEALLTDLQDLKPILEQQLRTHTQADDGCLDDLEECTLESLQHPAAIAPFYDFGYRLYTSASATTALRRMLRCTATGTADSYETILSAIAGGSSTQHYCYLVGGQVRDVLRGELSTDIDFNYTCSAKDVALVTVGREWPTKYKLIGQDTAPNYVLIGDESSDSYLEGFSIHFNATKASSHMDFRQNMLLYDLTNDVIIDKTGYGVHDVRARCLRLSCAGSGDSLHAWAENSNITAGFKQLRYIKFLLRALGKGLPLGTDSEERAFVVKSLESALKTNIGALRGFWFGYAFGAQLETAAGVAALKGWVEEHGKAGWWEEDWEPLMPVHSKESECVSDMPVNGSPNTTAQKSQGSAAASVIVTDLDVPAADQSVQPALVA